MTDSDKIDNELLSASIRAVRELIADELAAITAPLSRIELSSSLSKPSRFAFRFVMLSERTDTPLSVRSIRAVSSSRALAAAVNPTPISESRLLRSALRSVID